MECFFLNQTGGTDQIKTTHGIINTPKYEKEYYITNAENVQISP